MKKHLRLLGEFLGHLCVGTIMFVLLLFFGAGVNKLVHVVTPYVGDADFERVMKGLEVFILYADIVFLVWWVVFSTYKAIREMLHGEDDN